MSSGRGSGDAGFSLVELLIATGVMLIVSSIVTSGLLQMTRGQQTISNRTSMHSSVRSATELLQQEIGQAGRITASTQLSLDGPVVKNAPTAKLKPSVSDLFVGEVLSIEGSDNTLSITPESVKITNIDAATKAITVMQVASNGVLTNTFQFPHADNAAVIPAGGFGTGVVPPGYTIPAGLPNAGTVAGSTGSVLKLYGDVNGDGNMVYVEYTCDTTTNHALYRNMMAWKAASKPALTNANILLTNVQPNPPATTGGAELPCFQYQLDLSGNYVLDVAVTLTVETEQVDSVTRKKQRETKALLNISPRNVIGTWQAAGGNQNRIQPMPKEIANLLP